MFTEKGFLPVWEAYLKKNDSMYRFRALYTKICSSNILLFLGYTST